MAHDLTVEPVIATDRDLNALMEVFYRSLSRLYPVEERVRLVQQGLFSPSDRFFMGRLDHRPVGCAALVTARGAATVKHFYVRPAARDFGVGQSILSRLEADARMHKISKLRAQLGD